MSTPKVPAINIPGTLHGTRVIPTVPVASTILVIFLFFKLNFSKSGRNIDIGRIIARSCAPVTNPTPRETKNTVTVSCLELFIPCCILFKRLSKE